MLLGRLLGGQLVVFSRPLRLWRFPFEIVVLGLHLRAALVCVGHGGRPMLLQGRWCCVLLRRDGVEFDGRQLSGSEGLWLLGDVGPRDALAVRR